MWTVALEGGPRRVNHAAARVGDKIYSFGGYCSIDEMNDWDAIQVHILDTHSLRWTAGPSFTTDNAPPHRYGHTVVAVGEKIYLWGGRNNSTAYNSLSCFDTVKCIWTKISTKGTTTMARDGHTACVVNNKMYIFGGFEYLSNQYSQDMHCFNFTTSEWAFISARGSIPSHRDFHTAVVIGDFIYVFGGRGELIMENSAEEMYCRHLYRFNTLTNTWDSPATTGEIPEGRRSHSAWIYDGYMYIFGGYNGITNTHFNDLYRFCPNNNRWQLLKVGGRAPCKRRRQSCVVYRDKMYLFGGTSPYTENPESDDSDKTVDNSDLYILDFNTTLRTLCVLVVLKNKIDWSVLPRNICVDINTMTEPNQISRPIEKIG